MYEYYVRKVENVVDGDTIDVLIDLGFDILFQSRVRLAGIDTPESRTSDKAEKVLGLESKEYLKKHLKDAKSVVIKTELDTKKPVTESVVDKITTSQTSSSSKVLSESKAYENPQFKRMKDLMGKLK